LSGYLTRHETLREQPKKILASENFPVNAQSFVELLSQARAGSRDALGRLFERSRGYLLIVAHQEHDFRLHAKTSPSDLVQDTFFEAQRDFVAFRGTSEADFLAWMRRLLLNNIANFARSYCNTDKRSIHRELSLEGGNGDGRIDTPDDDSTPSWKAMANEQASAIDKALGSLPDAYRRVIILRYREERGWDEIARIMGSSANAARKLWLRAVEYMRQKIGRDVF
jgi:RNA polymerase sigma-70 factor, ECF subfamily